MRVTLVRDVFNGQIGNNWRFNGKISELRFSDTSKLVIVENSGWFSNSFAKRLILFRLVLVAIIREFEDIILRVEHRRISIRSISDTVFA